MKLLFKQALIVDKFSPFHLQKKDIFIDNGIIVKIDDSIQTDADKIISEEGLTLSNGFIDIFSHFNDPGFEQKETLETGAKAAQKGGYTKVFVLPNTQPAIDNKAQIEYVVNKSRTLPVQLFPMGTITSHYEGKALSEMIEMKDAGAVAFTDGIKCVQNASLLVKALQYIKQFDGVIIQMPYEASLTANGFMNESITSNQIGLMGIPAMAEEMMVARDIEICRYTKSRLHLTGISTKKSIQLINAAKKEGLDITCSVSPYHLRFTENDVEGYDTNLKVNPPLRTEEDRQALQEALLNGNIDSVASHHLPHETDVKQCEFANAHFGMSTIECTFQAIASIPTMNEQKVAELLSTNASGIFKIKQSVIAENNMADCTAFTLKGTSIISKENIISKGKNCGFIGKEMSGRIIATILEKNIYINE